MKKRQAALFSTPMFMCRECGSSYQRYCPRCHKLRIELEKATDIQDARRRFQRVYQSLLPKKDNTP